MQFGGNRCVRGAWLELMDKLQIVPTSPLVIPFSSCPFRHSRESGNDGGAVKHG